MPLSGCQNQRLAVGKTLVSRAPTVYRNLENIAVKVTKGNTLLLD